MQQLETRKQIVEAQEQQYKRMGKGRRLAQSRRIYRVLQTEDIFYVESESTNNVYYFVKFKPDVLQYCTCPDNSLSRRTNEISTYTPWNLQLEWGH